MPVNPFIAALGNVFEGLSIDSERKRKLLLEEAERRQQTADRLADRTERADAAAKADVRNQLLDYRQQQQDERRDVMDRIALMQYGATPVDANIASGQRQRDVTRGMGIAQDIMGTQPVISTQPPGLPPAQTQRGLTLAPADGLLKYDPQAQLAGILKGKRADLSAADTIMQNSVQVGGTRYNVPSTAQLQQTINEKAVEAATKLRADEAKEKKRQDIEDRTLQEQLLRDAGTPEDIIKQVTAGHRLSDLTLYPKGRDAPRPGESGQATEKERTAAGMLYGAEGELVELKKLLERYNPLSESTASRLLGAGGFETAQRGATSEEGRLYATSLLRIMTNYLYTVSGAQTTIGEITTQGRQMAALLFDSQETVDQKMRNIEGKLAEMRVMAGRAYVRQQPVVPFVPPGVSLAAKPKRNAQDMVDSALGKAQQPKDNK